MALCGLALVFSCSQSGQPSQSSQTNGISGLTNAQVVPAANPTGLTIGALFSLKQSPSLQTAIQFAVQDVNAQFTKAGVTFTVSVKFQDTQGNPALAYAGIQTLHDAGIRLIIGPEGNDATAAVLDYAKTNGMVVITPAAATSQLTTAGSNLFLMSPVDTQQAALLAFKQTAAGCLNLLTFSRADIYGQDLYRDLQNQLPAGSFFQQSYDINATTVDSFIDYSVEIATAFAYEVLTSNFTPNDQAAIAKAIAGVCLQTISNTEGAAILDVASQWVMLAEQASALYPMDTTLALSGLNSINLNQVKWYGSDGIVLAPQVTGDATAAQFAVDIGFRAPQFSVSPASFASFGAFLTRIGGGVTTQSIYAGNAYDAVQLAAATSFQLGGSLDSTKWMPQLPITSALFTGGNVTIQSVPFTSVTGNLAIAANGSRAEANYAMWGIKKNGNSYSWFIEEICSEGLATMQWTCIPYSPCGIPGYAC